MNNTVKDMNDLVATFDDVAKVLGFNGVTVPTIGVPDTKPFVVEIEGTDRSGKQSQSEKLCSYLESKGLTVKIVSFPRYDRKSCDGIKDYLGGRYGSVNDLDAYKSSMLYIYDRLNYTMTDWVEDKENYDVIIFDRWVGSNLIHQGVKSDNLNKFIAWETNLEYNVLNLPRPNMTIFLDMPIDLGKKIAKNRLNKANSSSKQDIHESNDEYMNKCYETAHKVAKKCGWFTVKCYNKFLWKKKVRSIEDISNEITSIINLPISHYKRIISGESIEDIIKELMDSDKTMIVKEN